MANQTGIGGIFHMIFLVLVLLSQLSSASVCSSSGIHFSSSAYVEKPFTSPNYPFNYRPSTTCLWSLSRPSTSYAVKLTFHYVSLESSTGCTHDYLEIRDGDSYSRSTLIGKFCGSRLPPIIVSKYKYLFVKFVSDRDYFPSTRKFQATFEAFIPSTLNGICSINSPFLHNNNLQLSSSSGGTFRSPSYPSYYPNNMVCTWKITAPAKKRLKISFDYFRLESGLCSSNDYLEVRDGSSSTSLRKGTYCGSYAPTITSSGQYLWIRFRSDSLTGYKGFEARYTFVKVASSKVVTVVAVLVAIVAIIAVVVAVIYYLKKKNRSVVRTQAVPIATTNTIVTTIQPPPAGYPRVILQHYPPPGAHPTQASAPGAIPRFAPGPPHHPENGVSYPATGVSINPGFGANPQPPGTVPATQGLPPYYGQ